MNLECLNDIITENLAIHIDLTNINSWLNWNTGLTAFSLTKWSGAISDNINLIDFGLTGFDNGRTNIMWSGITLTPQDNIFSMYRIGYNIVNNPTTGETSGITAITQFLPMSGITTGGTENYYFELDGGYLQGFFKLNGYNYELFPSRYNNGITIETILYLHSNSYGIFYMMGARAEDKYNPYFNGETLTGTTTTGVTTSLDNYLNALVETQTLKQSIVFPEQNKKIVITEPPQIDNIKNNIIAFEITQNKKLAYKYINDNGLIVTNTSPITITSTGFTLISIVFTPYDIIEDPDLLECASQRIGKLVFFINGRAVWTIKDFPEFYFNAFTNDKEKQIGVPYSISWGGGSFGLEHSYHYDYQTYGIYKGQDTTYVNNNFLVEADPISTECYIAPTGDTPINGLVLGINDMSFFTIDECNPSIIYPYTVMSIAYTGSTGSTFFVKYNNPVSILSNRIYDVNALVYSDCFFNDLATNKITILVYSDTVDVEILNEEVYTTGKNSWIPISTKFKITDNTGQQYVNIGLLIETSILPVLNNQMFVNNFTYTGADILVQDERKNNLLVEQNFNSGFIGGIQKLRIYDRAFTSTEILHNALIEAQNNSNIIISKGGRIIYR